MTTFERCPKCGRLNTGPLCACRPSSDGPPPTLTDFLLARIEDVEAEAHQLERHDKRAERLRLYGDRASGEVIMAPTRLLAECEAKRRIVEGMGRMFGEEAVAPFVLRALAAVYADYREGWKP